MIMYNLIKVQINPINNITKKSQIELKPLTHLIKLIINKTKTINKNQIQIQINNHKLINTTIIIKIALTTKIIIIKTVIITNIKIIKIIKTRIKNIVKMFKQIKM